MDLYWAQLCGATSCGQKVICNPCHIWRPSALLTPYHCSTQHPTTMYILCYISGWSAAMHLLWVALHVMFVHYHDGQVVLYGSAQCRTPKYTTAGVRRYVMCVHCNMTASNMSPQDPTTHQPLNPCCHKVTKMHTTINYLVPLGSNVSDLLSFEKILILQTSAVCKID